MEIKLNAREVKRLREISGPGPHFWIHQPSLLNRAWTAGFVEKSHGGSFRVQITNAGRQWLKEHDNE